MVSLGELLLPLAGFYALIEAVYSTGLVGLRGDLLLSTLCQRYSFICWRAG